MLILSWNILHGGGSRSAEILQYLEASEADLICLQEFRRAPDREKEYRDRLAAAGLGHSEFLETSDAKTNTLAIFSRAPLREVEPFLPGDTRGIQLKVQAERPFSLVVGHFPQKREQRPYFEALLDLPRSEWLEGEALVIGDLNCGIPLIDSDTKTFYASHLFQQLLRIGWVDAWRSRHKKAREFSWISPRSGNGFRYDQALASPAFDQRIREVKYDHVARESGLSDHSALLVELED